MTDRNILNMTDKEFEKLLDEVAGERAENVPLQPDPRYTETVMGKTINGGDYSVAYYYDSNGNPCTKSEATAVNIVEYTKDGGFVNECYGILGNPETP